MCYCASRNVIGNVASCPVEEEDVLFFIDDYHFGESHSAHLFLHSDENFDPGQLRSGHEVASGNNLKMLAIV